MSQTHKEVWLTNIPDDKTRKAVEDTLKQLRVYPSCAEYFTRLVTFCHEPVEVWGYRPVEEALQLKASLEGLGAQVELR